jgi:hypothetical protein
MEEGYSVLRELLMLLYRESGLLFIRLGRGLATFSVVGRDFCIICVDVYFKPTIKDIFKFTFSLNFFSILV